MKKKIKKWEFSFETRNEQKPVTVSMELVGMKLTAEICFDGACMGLEEVWFQPTDWIYGFSNGEDRFLIVIKEVVFCETYEVWCYQNGYSLSDDSTTELFRKKLENPRFHELPYEKKNRIKGLWIDVFVSVLVGTVLLFVLWQDGVWWEQVIRAFLYITLFWAYKGIRALADRRMRKNLLRQLLDATGECR